MYTLTFDAESIQDLLDHRKYDGRQFFGAVVAPYSGLFTSGSNRFYTELPKILCPYQINDIIIIQERWARDSSGYIYESDSNAGAYDYRPAYTMPNDAARLYGRIVSTTPWLATPDIIRKYIPQSLLIDSCAGCAKVIGTTDTGNRLLNRIRKSRNKEALNKTYQPIARLSDPDNKVLQYIPYQLSKPYRPVINFYNGENIWMVSSTISDSAVAYYSPYGTETDPNALDSHEPINTIRSGHDDYINDAWTTYPTSLTESEAEYVKLSGVKLFKRGLAKNSPSTSGDDAKYIYLILDQKGNPIPIYAYYVTEAIPSDQKIFVWLISGYLCDESGHILNESNIF